MYTKPIEDTQIGHSLDNVMLLDRSYLAKLILTGNAADVASYLDEAKCLAINNYLENHETPLFFACYHGKKDVVKCLLAKAADVNAPSMGGRALHGASTSGNLQVVCLLLDHGADVNGLDFYKNTALHIACQQQDVDMCKLLLSRGADVSAPNVDLDTPLHIAALHAGAEIIKLLLDSGAFIESQNSGGSTPLSLAFACNNEEAGRALLLGKASLVNLNLSIESSIPDWVGGELAKIIAVKQREINNLKKQNASNPKSENEEKKINNQLKALREQMTNWEANTNKKMGTTLLDDVLSAQKKKLLIQQQELSRIKQENDILQQKISPFGNVSLPWQGAEGTVNDQTLHLDKVHQQWQDILQQLQEAEEKLARSDSTETQLQIQLIVGCKQIRNDFFTLTRQFKRKCSDLLRELHALLETVCGCLLNLESQAQPRNKDEYLLAARATFIHLHAMRKYKQLGTQLNEIDNLLSECERELKKQQELEYLQDVKLQQLTKLFTTTQEAKIGLEFLQSFCKSASLPASWELQITEVIPWVQLKHHAELGVGLLYDLLNQMNLKCAWDISTLKIHLNELLRWHVAIFNEANPIEILNDNVDRIKKSVAILETLHSVSLPVISVSEWNASTTGLIATVRQLKKTESEHHYRAKCLNLLLLLNWIANQCGVPENPFTLQHQDDTSQLHLGYAELKCPGWSKLLDETKTGTQKRTFIKTCRIIAVELASREKPLESKNLVNQLHEKATQSEIKPDVHSSQAEKKSVKLVDEKKDKKERKSNKSRASHQASQKNKLATGNAKPQPPSAPGKPKEKLETSRVRPQDPRHFQSVATLRAPAHTNTSVSAMSVIDLSLFAPRKALTPMLSIRDYKRKQQRLPNAVSRQESVVLEDLDGYLSQINTIVQAHQEFCEQGGLKDSSHLSVEQKKSVLEFAVAWHYAHGQMVSYLVTLPDQHIAKIHLFKQDLYCGKRTYNRQKHQYFPDVTISFDETTLENYLPQQCLLPVESLREAIKLLTRSQYPLDKSTETAAEIIKAWSSYLDREFSRYKISSLTQDMTVAEFTDWLQQKLSDYTTEICHLLTTPETLVRNLNIQFYLVRVGEIVGHISTQDYARTPYLKFCRRFRNWAVHELIEPPLDYSELADLLQTELFPAKTALYVNRSYQYKREELSLLIDLRLNTLRQHLKEHAPLLVCESLELKPNTNLYSILAEKIQQFNQGYGILFIPAQCEGRQFVIAMRFKSKEVEICYVNVLGYHESILKCINGIADNWAATSPQKIKPKVKAFEASCLEDEKSSAVWQVELCALLAERRLQADKLLDTSVHTHLPSKQQAAMLMQLRKNHFELAWQHGHHECYFNQQLMKTSEEPYQVTPQDSDALRI